MFSGSRTNTNSSPTLNNSCRHMSNARVCCKPAMYTSHRSMLEGAKGAGLCAAPTCAAKARCVNPVATSSGMPERSCRNVRRCCIVQRLNRARRMLSRYIGGCGKCIVANVSQHQRHFRHSENASLRRSIAFQSLSEKVSSIEFP